MPPNMLKLSYVVIFPDNSFIPYLYPHQPGGNPHGHLPDLDLLLTPWGNPLHFAV